MIVELRELEFTLEVPEASERASERSAASLLIRRHPPI